MNKTPKAPLFDQGVEYWENEVHYLTTACDSLRTAYAVLHSMLTQAHAKLADLTPDREEVDE